MSALHTNGLASAIEPPLWVCVCSFWRRRCTMHVLMINWKRSNYSSAQAVIPHCKTW